MSNDVRDEMPYRATGTAEAAVAGLEILKEQGELGSCVRPSHMSVYNHHRAFRTEADEYFNDAVIKIIAHGENQKKTDVRAKWKDGTPAPARAIINQQWVFNTSEDPRDHQVPIITTTEVFHEKSVEEIMWIWVMNSNKIEDLHQFDNHIWDKWVIQTGPWAGTIGPAYGWQLAQKYRTVNGQPMSQVEFLLHALTHSPGSRRIKTTLWVPQHLDEMALEPCVWTTHWQVFKGQLHLTVDIRSNDLCIGNPFNTYQYYVLQQMVCQVTGIPSGSLTFNITNLHIYDRHFFNVMDQIKEPTFASPKLVINPDIKNFFDFKPSDIMLSNYRHSKKFRYEIAE